MNWTSLEYSKSKVRKAGEVLTALDLDVNEYLDAHEVLSNWRSSHAYPMHSILIFLRKKAKEADKDAIVVQRLKRAPSIIGKLFRERGMDLDRMQDIAGCRAVVSNIKKVKQLEISIRGSRTRNKLHSSKDYIENPKKSGYRGIHLIFKYSGAKEQYSNLFVEIQIRSRIQHAWATAVEVVDLFTSQALKSSQGQKEWEDFFRYASAEFAKIEKTPVDAELRGVDTKMELQALTSELKVIEKLRAFSVTTGHIAERHKHEGDVYYLLVLDTKDGSIMYSVHPSSMLDDATSMYAQYERDYKDDPSKNVVLVSSDSIQDLKKAYPNYFADTRGFVSLVEKCIGAGQQ